MAAPMWTGRPSSSAGYWRGGMSDGPLWQGQGSYGPSAQGVGIVPPGSGAQGGSGWTPTLIYLFLFVVAEMVLVKCLERMLR